VSFPAISLVEFVTGQPHAPETEILPLIVLLIEKLSSSNFLTY